MDFSSGIRNRPFADHAAALERAGREDATHDHAGGSFAPRAGSQTTWGSSGSRIAVLPLFGMLSQRNDPMDFAGDTSLEAVGAVFNQLLKDSSVSSIVLDVDSPGGWRLRSGRAGSANLRGARAETNRRDRELAGGQRRVLDRDGRRRALLYAVRRSGLDRDRRDARGLVEPKTPPASTSR